MKRTSLSLALGLALAGGQASATGWIGEFLINAPNKMVQAGGQFNATIHLGGPCDVDVQYKAGGKTFHRILNNVSGQPYSVQLPTTGLVGGDLPLGIYTVTATTANPAKCTTYGNNADTLTVAGTGYVAGVKVAAPNTVEAGKTFSASVLGSGTCPVNISFKGGKGGNFGWNVPSMAVGVHSNWPTTGLIGGNLVPDTYTVSASTTNPNLCPNGGGNWSDILTVSPPPPPPPPPKAGGQLNGILFNPMAPASGQPVKVTVAGTGACAFKLSLGGLDGILFNQPDASVKTLPYSVTVTPDQVGNFNVSATPVAGLPLASACDGGAKSAQVAVTGGATRPNLVLTLEGSRSKDEVRSDPRPGNSNHKVGQHGFIFTWKVANTGNLASLPGRLRVNCDMKSASDSTTHCRSDNGTGHASHTVDVPPLAPGKSFTTDFNDWPVLYDTFKDVTCGSLSNPGFNATITGTLSGNPSDLDQANNKVTLPLFVPSIPPPPPPMVNGKYPPPCTW